MSDNSNTTVVNKGVSMLGLLGVVLVVMKAMGWGAVATWPWWLVLLPFYLGLAIVGAVFIIAMLILGIVALMER